MMSDRTQDRNATVTQTTQEDRALRRRVERLLNTTIDFVPNDEFCDETIELDYSSAATTVPEAGTGDGPADLPRPPGVYRAPEAGEPAAVQALIRPVWLPRSSRCLPDFSTEVFQLAVPTSSAAVRGPRSCSLLA